MGCGGSKEDSAAKQRNDAIENQLKRDKMLMRCVPPVLSLFSFLAWSENQEAVGLRGGGEVGVSEDARV